MKCVWGVLSLVTFLSRSEIFRTMKPSDFVLKIGIRRLRQRLPLNQR